MIEVRFPRPQKKTALRASSHRAANGSGDWTRTSDKAVNSRLLYQLSYAGSVESRF